MPPPGAPTTPYTFSTADKAVAWNTPNATDAINRALFGSTVAGIVRGFQFAVSGTAYTVNVVVGDEGDSLAVYHTGDGYSLTIRKLTTIACALSSSYDGVDVVLCLYASYSTSAATVAEIRAYTVAQYNASPDKPSLVCLGTVSVPSGGTITDAHLSTYRRTVAGAGIPVGLRPSHNLVRNPLFERGLVLWERAVTAGSMTLASGSSGTHKRALGNAVQGSYLAVTYGGAAADGAVSQVLDAMVYNDPLVWELYLKRVQALTAGSLALRFAWKTADGSDLTPTSVAVSLGATDSSVLRVAGVVTVPPTAQRLWSVALVFTGATWGASSLALVVNTLNVLRRPRFEETEPVGGYARGNVTAGVLDVEEDGGADAAAAARFTFATGVLAEGLLTLAGRAASALPSLGLVGRLLVGSGRISTAADALLARIAPSVRTSGGSHTLLIETTAAPSQRLRLYARAPTSGHVIELRISVNASIDTGGSWTKDESGEAAFMLSVGDEGLTLYTRGAGAGGSWGDGSWTTSALSLTATRLDLEDVPIFFRHTTSQSNLASTTAPRANGVYPLSILKAWAFLTTDGAANVAVTDGFNIASATFNGKRVVVTLATPVTTPYAVTFGAQASVAITLTSIQLSTTVFWVYAFDATGAELDQRAAALTYSFHVAGRQSSS